MSTPQEMLEALGRQARARRANDGDRAPRTYRGRSVEELIPVIQRELGAEAIVVRRREGLSGGVLGFFQHPFVEIEAMPGTPRVDVYDEVDSVPPPPLPVPSASPGPPAEAVLLAPTPPAQPSPPVQSPAPRRAESQPPPVVSPPAPAPAPSAPAPAPAPSASPPRAPAPTAAAPPPLFYARNPPVGAADTAEPAAPAPVPLAASAPGSAYVTAHLAALARADRSQARREPPARRSAVERPRNPINPIGAAPLGAPDALDRQPWSDDFQEISPSDVPELFPPVAQRAPVPAPLRPAAPERRVVAPGSHARARTGVSKSLQRYGISEQLAEELIDGASAHAMALSPRAGMAQAVRSTLAQRIPVAPPLPTKGAAIVVVGAGGAGKTTCCAALLGAYRKSSSLPASFATFSRANRVAREAERQELQMILSPHIMKPTPARTPRALRALRRARGDGMAVLDTPNLSPSDRAGIRELASLLAELKPERVVVALPATLSATAAAQLLQALRPLGANSLAVTHADETDQIGVAVEAACRFGLAPEYLLDRGRGGGWRLSRLDPAGLAARLLP